MCRLNACPLFDVSWGRAMLYGAPSVAYNQYSARHNASPAAASSVYALLVLTRPGQATLE